MTFTKIFLIGFMGSGKTTLAPKLANKLGIAHFDLDEIIESETGKSISQLFEIQGEKKFRELESNCLSEFIEKNQNFVLATGGGTPCFGKSMELMNSKGLTIYIELSAKTLMQRIIPGKKSRPLLSDLNDDQLLEYIEKKLIERNPYYKKSMICIDGLSAKADSIAHAIQNYSR